MFFRTVVGAPSPFVTKWDGAETKARVQWIKDYTKQFPDVFSLSNIYMDAKIDPLTAEVTAAYEPVSTLAREYTDAIILGTKPVSSLDEMATKWLDGGGQVATDYINKVNMKYFEK